MLTRPTCENACGKLPSRRLRRRVVLLGEQADVVGERRRSRCEQRARLVAAAEHAQVVGQPEAAGEERALARRQAVDRLVRAVAQHQAVDRELALDRRDGGHARADRRPAGSRSAGSAAGWRRAPPSRSTARSSRACGVEAARADVGVDARAQLAPALDRPGEAEVLGHLHAAVERHPAITFECVKWRARRRAPPRCPRRARVHAFSRCSSSARCSAQALVVAREAALARLVERVHHLAVDVELQLRRGGVADAHRLRALVARRARAAPTPAGAARRRCRT